MNFKNGVFYIFSRSPALPKKPYKWPLFPIACQNVQEACKAVKGILKGQIKGQNSTSSGADFGQAGGAAREKCRAKTRGRARQESNARIANIIVQR